MKNEKNSLPLDKKKAYKIALLGPLVKENTKAMFESVAGANVSFVAEKGFDLTARKKDVPNLARRNPEAIDKMVAMAKDADVAVVFVGGDEYIAKDAFFANAIGAGATIDLVGAQDELVEKIYTKFEKIITEIEKNSELK